MMKKKKRQTMKKDGVDFTSYISEISEICEVATVDNIAMASIAEEVRDVERPTHCPRLIVHKDVIHCIRCIFSSILVFKRTIW
jgi:hypothetical protein